MEVFSCIFRDINRFKGGWEEKWNGGIVISTEPCDERSDQGSKF